MLEYRENQPRCAHVAALRKQQILASVNRLDDLSNRIVLKRIRQERNGRDLEARVIRPAERVDVEQAILCAHRQDGRLLLRPAVGKLQEIRSEPKVRLAFLRDQMHMGEHHSCNSSITSPASSIFIFVTKTGVP